MSSQEIVKFSNLEVQNSIVEKYVYDYWSPDKEYRWWFDRRDSIPFFVDEREYKGVVNYDIKIESTDRRNVNFTESLILYKQKIIFDHFDYNKTDSILKLSGRIFVERTGENWRADKTGVDIYIGKRRDTVRNIHFKFLWSNQNVITKFKGKTIEDSIVLDQFPSFYLYDYSQTTSTQEGKNISFSMISKVSEDDILVFGLSSTFVETYDIGKLIFGNQKFDKSKVPIGDNNSEPMVILQNNKIYDNISQEFETSDKYYGSVTSAERFIVNGNYPRALREYKDLSREYKLFARDIHNALRCAILSNDVDSAIRWADTLNTLGVKSDYYKHSVFTKVSRNKNWTAFLSDANNYKAPTIDYDFREKLDQLVLKDQEVFELNAKKSIEWSEVLKRTDSVTERFIALIDKYGFPVEEKVGVELKGDHIISTPEYYVLIRHAYQTRNQNIDKLTEILEENGSNHKYDYLRDKLNIFLDNRTCYNIYKGNLYKDNSCFVIDTEVQKNIEFSFRNPYDFVLSNMDYIITPYVKEREEEDDSFFKNNYTFLSKLTDDWNWNEKD